MRNFYQKYKSIIHFVLCILAIQLIVLAYDRIEGFNDGYIKDWHINRLFGLTYLSVFILFLFAKIFQTTKREYLKIISVTVILIFFFTLLLEGISILLVKSQIVEIRHTPSYPFLKLVIPFEYDNNTKTMSKPIWADTSRYWGVWHYSKIYSQTADCYNVIDTINSFGARDKERNLKTTNGRFVVLGDSFTEGFGVAKSDRYSNKLEKVSGVEHLNFGVGGYCGPTQYYMIYKHLAKKFSHDAIIIGIFPSNDFDDDDIANYDNRYRPFWTGSYPNYNLIYKVDEVQKSEWFPENFQKLMYNSQYSKYQLTQKELPQNYSYFWNIITSIATGYKQDFYSQSQYHSRYENFGVENWNKLCYSIKKIREEAPDKEIILLTFPKWDDLVVRKGKKEKLKLTNTMEVFANKEKYVYVDILEYFYANSTDWKSLFLLCDGHWSEEGHRLASKALLENKEYQKLTKSLKK